ncbi:unnamed protein product [Anisakis simplex]|uniref:NCK-interacting protein with SH3 domain (inferred by orthology to a human protein) n=1 Tax=Anisakis simplex TaxID=6269 RepID=A0A0M3JUC3_ANISI|nr:unnamed protein product [Anisakis simplex]
MYEPVLNVREKAQELIDIVREQTNAPIAVCVDTVATILGSLLTDLPAEEGLRSIRNAILSPNVINVDDCYDAKLLKALIIELTDNIEDKQQQSWTIQDDEQNLISALQQFSSILKNADRRVCLKLLRQSDFTFVQRLVSLYQIDQRGNVSLNVLQTIRQCCELDKTCFVQDSISWSIILSSFLLPHLTFSISSIPYLRINLFLSDYFTVEFLSKMLSLLQDSNQLIMRFILNFNLHFDESENLIVEALKQNGCLAFGQLLIDELNRQRNMNDLSAIKMVLDVFRAQPQIVSTTFYDNDLRVLCAVLCQDLLDTDIPKKITMILEVLERLWSISQGHLNNRREILDSLQTLLLSKELSDQHKRQAQTIIDNQLRNQSESESEQNVIMI